VAATLDQLEAVYRSRLTEFRRVAAAIVADVDRGRDAVQEAFVTAVRRRSTFRGTGHSKRALANRAQPASI
jgi:DNA-directed RNA polymerase specialized sigma24 family protein